VFAAVDDVARKSSEAKGQLPSVKEKCAKQDEQNSREKKDAAEFTKRLHLFILAEEASGRLEEPVQFA